MTEYIKREDALSLKKPFPNQEGMVTLYRQYFIDPEAVEQLPASDVVEVVRCKDCKHRPSKPGKYDSGCDIAFPDEVCPCHCIDTYYSWYPKDAWFCPNGKRKDGDGE